MKKTLSSNETIALNIGVIILFGIISYFIGTSGPAFRKSGLGGLGAIIVLPMITIGGIMLYLVGRLVISEYQYLLTAIASLANLFVAYQYHFGYW